MKRTVLSLIGAALLSLIAATAAAEFCDKCRDKMYTADIGQCVCLAQLGRDGAPTDEAATPPGKPSAGKRSKGVELTDADNGKTIKVAVGKPLRISLEGNPTTGFQWQTGKIEGASVREEGKVEYVAKKRPAGMVGVGGAFVFRFKAVKPGKSEIKLVYLRPWEKNTPPAKSFVVKIEAESK